MMPRTAAAGNSRATLWAKDKVALDQVKGMKNTINVTKCLLWQLFMVYIQRLKAELARYRR